MGVERVGVKRGGVENLAVVGINKKMEVRDKKSMPRIGKGQWQHDDHLPSVMFAMGLMLDDL